MKRRPPSATARWERSRAASIVRAPGCRICFPSTAPTTSARIIPRAQFSPQAGAADQPSLSDRVSIQGKQEALARSKIRARARTRLKTTRKLTSRNRRRTAADERENRRDHEQDDRNKEDDLCDLDRETRDPTKAEDSRNQRNNQKRQSPTKHGGAPSLSKCAQGVVRLRIVLFINDQCAGMFRRVSFLTMGAAVSRKLAPPAPSAASRIAPKDARPR